MVEAFKIEITAIRIHQTSRKRNISRVKSIYLFDRVKKKKKNETFSRAESLVQILKRR